MYAGTLNASLTTAQDHNLFFWLIKNTSLTNPDLVLWINGGPGSSSMFGLFQENGPILISRNGTGPDDFIVGLNKAGSWSDLADVIFLDQPVGTGFSYGNSYLERMEDGAQEFVRFLDLFLRKFPEYQKGAQNRSLLLTGESFSGTYLPQFARHVAVYNENSAIQVNLKAVLIGNPIVSPVIQRTQTHKVSQALGIIDDMNME